MKYYNYSELRESKLIFDRKPPAFGVVMVLLTLAFLVAALCWAGFSTKVYVVKATGIATDAEKINITNSVAGEIKTINVIEGQRVQKGDLLITFDTYQVDLQIEQYAAMVELYQTRVDNTNKLVRFINDYQLADAETKINPFDKSQPETAKLCSDAEYFIKYIEQQLELGVDLNEQKISDIKTQYISQNSYYSILDEYVAQITQFSAQKRMYEDSRTMYSIVALQDGIVHLTTGLTIGTTIQAGTLLGNIATGNEDNIVFTVSVNATDRSKIAIDNEVEIVVAGVMQTEYGVLKGNVIAVDNDATQTQDGNVYYVVTVKPESTQMFDKKEYIVDITVGMLGECHIKYNETIWLKWMIEQIGIKLN